MAGEGIIVGLKLGYFDRYQEVWVWLYILVSARGRNGLFEWNLWNIKCLESFQIHKNNGENTFIWPTFIRLVEKSLLSKEQQYAKIQNFTNFQLEYCFHAFPRARSVVWANDQRYCPMSI